MKRTYPLSFFLFGLAMNFFFRYFYLLLPGMILCIIGIWKLPCLLIGLAVLGLDLLLSFTEQLQTRKASLEDSDNPEYNEFMDTCFGDNPDGIQELLAQKMEAQDQARTARQKALERLVIYRQLKQSIHDNMTLDEMIDAFIQMCQTPVGEPDDLLFETGTFSFTGERLFHFSLVRQFCFFSDTDEYVQLHLDIQYAPCAKTRLLKKATWSPTKDQNFLSTVKDSIAYRSVRNMPYIKAEVWIDET